MSDQNEETKAPEKPEARVVVRVPDHLRDSFVASCKGQDTTASQELRRFMRDYVKKHGQGEMPV